MLQVSSSSHSFLRTPLSFLPIGNVQCCSVLAGLYRFVFFSIVLSLLIRTQLSAHLAQRLREISPPPVSIELTCLSVSFRVAVGASFKTFLSSLYFVNIPPLLFSFCDSFFLLSIKAVFFITSGLCAATKVGIVLQLVLPQLPPFTRFPGVCYPLW